jgi:hypothetical protein
MSRLKELAVQAWYETFQDYKIGDLGSGDAEEALSWHCPNSIMLAEVIEKLDKQEVGEFVTFYTEINKSPCPEEEIAALSYLYDALAIVRDRNTDYVINQELPAFKAAVGLADTFASNADNLPRPGDVTCGLDLSQERDVDNPAYRRMDLTELCMNFANATQAPVKAEHFESKPGHAVRFSPKNGQTILVQDLLAITPHMLRKLNNTFG